jgi:hypothetical protein
MPDARKRHIVVRATIWLRKKGRELAQRIGTRAAAIGAARATRRRGAAMAMRCDDDGAALAMALALARREAVDAMRWKWRCNGDGDTSTRYGGSVPLWKSE